MGCLQMGYGAVICELLWQLVLKASEGDMSLQLQWFLQFIPVIGSIELERKATKEGIGFRGDEYEARPNQQEHTGRSGG